MDTSRNRFAKGRLSWKSLGLLLVSFSCFSSETGRGCGGWYEEAPPTLDVYLNRLPGKTLGQIFIETGVNPPNGPAPKVREALDEILVRLKKGEKGADLAAEVEKLREGVRRSSLGSHGDLALLHDFRDALLSKPESAESYLRWRLDHSDEIGNVVTYAERYSHESPKALPVEIRKDVEARLETKEDPMRPHWLYVRGALDFNFEVPSCGESWFQDVVDQFPDHPRAEAAQYMIARSLLRSARRNWGSGVNGEEEDRRIAETRNRAKAAFEKYAALYPNGRFLPDVYGWLGGLTEGEASLRYFIQQIELKNHPEVLKSGIIMIQKRIDDLDLESEEGKNAVAEIAKYPRIAMGLLYIVLNRRAKEVQEEGGLTRLNGKANRRWREKVLPMIAKAVSDQKEAYVPESIWQSRYLAILVHAASESGDQKTALKLASSKVRPNDDFLFAKALAHARAGRGEDAVAAFHELISVFPESPLVGAAKVRSALALVDLKRSGEAVISLMTLKESGLGDDESRYWDTIYPPADRELDFTSSPIRPIISNAEENQVSQLIDSLLNFSPIDQLRAAVENRPIDRYRFKIQEVVAQRALAIEDFAVAKKMMSEADFEKRAGNLLGKAEAAKAAKTAAKQAALYEELGDLWAANRGETLPFPLDKEQVPEYEGDTNGWLRRRNNGAALGIEKPETELDARDELFHAMKYWALAAQKEKGAQAKANILLKRSQTMEAIARFSPYGLKRAIEEGWEAESRRLRTEVLTLSKIVGAKAAYWTFPTTADRFSIYDGRLDYIIHRAGYRFLAYGYIPEASDSGGSSDRAAWSDIRERILALRHSTLTASELRAEVAAIHQKIKANYTSINEAAALNFAEDVALFLNTDKVPDEVAREYVDLRLDILNDSFSDYAPVRPPLVPELSEGERAGKGEDHWLRRRIAKARESEAFKPYLDFLDFAEAAVIANTQVKMRLRTDPETGGGGWWLETDREKENMGVFITRDYPEIEVRMSQFLEKYPQSLKREAALLLLARSIFRQSWPYYERTGDRRGGFREFKWGPFKEERVTKALDRYDKEFPEGRYTWEIKAMRGAVALQSKNWEKAIAQELEILEGTKADLHEASAMRLAQIFGALDQPGDRPAIMAAIEENPRSKPYLEKYLFTADRERYHPLRYLQDFLRDELKLTAPEKSEGSEG